MPEPTFPVEERILLVDDNPLNLQVLRETLQSRQSKLLVAKSGASALAISRKTIPDLILLDIMMPGMDGYQVIGALKADAATADIPVIFLSALDQTVDKVKGFTLGAVDYITKPFQAEEVLARVETHLTIHRLKQEVEQQKDQLEKELQTVSRVQRNLLPKTLPALDGLELEAYYATSRYAGGDYYDVVTLGSGQLGVLVADAEGHSTPAAVLMAMTCALFRSLRRLWDQPAQLLARMNHHLCKVAEPSFVTALYLLVDLPAGKVRMARAGHPPPMVFWGARGMAEEIKAPGVMMMGFDEYDNVPEAELSFRPGDQVLAYTDGLTERFGPGGQLYGEARLLGILQSHGAASAKTLCRAVVDDLERFADGRAADDDQAFVAIKHI